MATMAKHDKVSESAAGQGENRLARHGHVSYLEIPALDIEKSSAFYEAVFGWNVQRRDNGQASFDDRSGDLIGKWVTCRAVARESAVLPYIYVDGIDAAVERAVAQGAEVVKPVYQEGDVWVATVRDPAGNIIGIWQFGPRWSVHSGGNRVASALECNRQIE
jgi:uncharacterized protein